MKTQLQGLASGHPPFSIIHFLAAQGIYLAWFFVGWFFDRPVSEAVGVGAMWALAYLLGAFAVLQIRWKGFLRRRTGTKAPAPEAVLRALEEEHQGARAAARAAVGTQADP